MQQILKQSDATMSLILIVDDDRLMNETLAQIVRRMGHQVDCAFSLREGLRKSGAVSYDLVLLDVYLPDGNGVNRLPEFRSMASDPEIIIITGQGDADGAELAIISGAWNYLQKPVSVKVLNLSVVRALQYRVEKLARTGPIVLKRDRIIGTSDQLQSCLDLVAQASRNHISVLISGETGTGKELFALAIHENSRRSAKNFVVVDCAALPGNLVESTLFGHVKGAFTGADKSREGLIKQADGGTLFLDEIGELPFTMQKTFLRVLQEHRFRPVGSTQEVTSDFRLVAATNRNLKDMVTQGHFREDLLYRLQGMPIVVPPLREHLSDIKGITQHMVPKLCDRYGIATKGISQDFFETLTSHDWPGNVRELIQALELALATAGENSTLFSSHLPMHLRVQQVRASIAPSTAGNPETKKDSGTPGPPVSFREFRNIIEKQYVEDLLSYTDKNIPEACRLSGLSRSRIYQLQRKYKKS